MNLVLIAFIGTVVNVVCISVGFWVGKHRATTSQPRPLDRPLETTKTSSQSAGRSDKQASEVERLRGYIAKLTEHKRNDHLRWPDLMAQTFLAFDDKEKAAFFSRLAVRVRAEQGALMRRRDWQPMIGRMHFDALFLMARVLAPMMDEELRVLWDYKPRLERTDDLRGGR